MASTDDGCRESCRQPRECCEENEMSSVAYTSNSYLTRAMWHWMKFQQNMMKYLYSRQNTPSHKDQNTWRQNSRNSTSQRRRYNVVEGECEACRKEAFEFRISNKKWIDQGRFVRSYQRELNIVDKTSVDEAMSDDDYFEMDLDEEFKKFLEISEKHRQEREKAKKQKSNCSKRRNDEITKSDELEDDVEYIDVCKKPLMPTTNAPSHVNKGKEYKELYGDQAERILCLEASMQLNFDRFCDRNKPVFWPYIPLKF